MIVEVLRKGLNAEIEDVQRRGLVGSQDTTEEPKKQAQKRKEESDGLTVTFDDGTIRESYLSRKSFRQLLGLQAGQPKAEPKPAVATPVGNGPAVVK